MSLALVCSCISALRTSLTAAYGMPLPSNTSSHSCVVFVAEIFSISASSSSRFATRDALILNFGSSFHSGRPRPSQRMPNRRSLPPPKRISPSLVLKDLYGTMEAVTGQD
jgi:hypothetical protein